MLEPRLEKRHHRCQPYGSAHYGRERRDPGTLLAGAWNAANFAIGCRLAVSEGAEPLIERDGRLAVVALCSSTAIGRDVKTRERGCGV